VELAKGYKILILIASCLFFACICVPFVAVPGLHEFITYTAYMIIVALFALLVAVVRKMELTEKDKILVSIILCLFFVHVIHGIYGTFITSHSAYTVFDDYWLPVSFFVLFVWSWGIMILNSIGIVFEQFSWGTPTYTFFCIIAWISLFVLIKYTKGMKLVPRIVYLYLIPALVMSLAYLYRLPLH